MNREQILQAIGANQTIKGVDLSGIDLSGTDLTGGRFEDVLFQNADLRGVNILKTGIKKCDFSGANLDALRRTRRQRTGRRARRTHLGAAPPSQTRLRFNTGDGSG